MKPLIANAMDRTQIFLESCYQIKIPERVSKFSSTEYSVANVGTILCNNVTQGDLELSVLLDRDYFSASLDRLSSDHYSVIFEEVSHFFLLGAHHLRGTQVTPIELEAQSEIDRLVCCLSLETEVATAVAAHLRNKLYYERYSDAVHEKARILAISFLQQLSSTKPHSWNNKDFFKLNQFFNSDLSKKFSLARCF